MNPVNSLAIATTTTVERLPRAVRL